MPRIWGANLDLSVLQNLTCSGVCRVPADMKRAAAGGPAHLVMASSASPSSMPWYLRWSRVLSSAPSRTPVHACISTTGGALPSHVPWESERERESLDPNTNE